MAQHNELGKQGEEFAAKILAQKGYTILDRNWRSGRSELDIIATKDNLLIVVEVKTRRNNIFADPTQSITLKKVQLLLNGASDYIQQKNIDLDIRLDVFTIIIKDTQTNQFSYEHIEDAITTCNIPIGVGR